MADKPLHVLDAGMSNLYAYRLGLCARDTMRAPGGDLIDTGLVLRRELEAMGFAIVRKHHDRCNYRGTPADCNCDFLNLSEEPAS